MRFSLSPGCEPNPHALSAFARASESHDIIATQDIVDARGVKLWARGQPVTSALHQKLLERRLRQPMEACLQAQDGVTLFTLMDELSGFIDSSSALAAAVRPYAMLLIAQLKQLPLHAVAQLLLTTAWAIRPSTLAHAVTGMALAGAMVAARKGPLHEVRLAMLGGLLHDMGEVYINPQHLDYTHALDLNGHKQLVVHPRVAQMLLAELTDYPAVLGRAIAEHHERLDRSGYPARLSTDQVSTLGRVLAIVEVTLGSLSSSHAALTRASFALRVVPGEFDPDWASFIIEAAQAAQEDILADSLPLTATLAAQLANIDRQLADAHRLAEELHEQRRTATTIDVVADALYRLDRLRVAWNSLGLWGMSNQEATPAERLELEMAEGELRQRMRSFHRECMLLSEGLTEAEKFRLAPLWRGLVSDEAAPDA